MSAVVKWGDVDSVTDRVTVQFLSSAIEVLFTN